MGRIWKEGGGEILLIFKNIKSLNLPLQFQFIYIYLKLAKETNLETNLGNEPPKKSPTLVPYTSPKIKFCHNA